ncbi:MAG: glycosyltransferase [Chloroflexi bacterium]|nr:glycosyltransferase [Chloroflexota bacterium]
MSAQLPEPPHAGGTLRTNGLMRAVHAAGHEVYLLAFASADQLKISSAALDEFCACVEIVPPPSRKIMHRLRDLLLSSKADMQRRFFSLMYAGQLERLLKQTSFDLIQIESLEMTTYLSVIQQTLPDTPVIYDSFNAEYDLQRSIFLAEKHDLRHLPGAVYSWIQWRRLTRYEREVCHAVSHVIAVSDADAAAFDRLAPGCAVSIVPNGIDTQTYAQHDPSLDLGSCALVFTGSMSYRPNIDAAVWFADHILDKVRAHVPEARFFVVGSQPHPRLNALRKRDDVQITGWVPDARPFLHAAAVYVAPLRMGSGTRLKLLQAMAAGRAVVSTSMGAMGLHATDGVELRLADQADEFAQAVIELLQNPARREKLGQAGADYVQRHYDWSVIAPKLFHVYDQVKR